MSKLHRISAGGLVFRDDTILLVRYADAIAGTFLVGPGGGLEEYENVPQAIVREVYEETGVTVRPEQVVFIEDLLSAQFKISKIWMICHVVEGEIGHTDEAIKEGILEAAWFSREQLAGEVVFPPPLMEYDWHQLCSETWRVQCLPTRIVNF